MQPGQSIQRVIDGAPSSATVCVTKGVYRLTQELRPRWGSTLLFESGAVLNGSRPVTEWRATSGQWVARGQTQSIESSSGRCSERPVACQYEDLYFDGKPLTRVLSRSALRPGTFYFDEANDSIYLADDPTGHSVEATVAETAIRAGGAQNITVRNATIEKFGKHGIVTSGGWLVADNEIRYVHSHGLRVFGNSRVEGNLIHHTGNMGILADNGVGLVFEGNQLHHNNYLGFDLWHAGATKITGSRGTVVRDNWSHHNTGDGWWFDWDNIDSVVEGNVFEHNSRFGLLYEASFDARVAGNTFRRNGTVDSGDGSGGGVYLNTSRNVEVANNAFELNTKRSLGLASTDRGTSSAYGKREIANLHVHDNTFTLTDGYIGVDYGTTEIYSAAANNRFTANTYAVTDTQGTWWRWGTVGDRHRSYTWSQWNAAGQDRSGRVSATP